MTLPLTTTTILSPVAPAAPGAAPASSETPVGIEFQPVLAALTEAAANASGAVVPTALPPALPTAATGKPLPAGGGSLPVAGGELPELSIEQALAGVAGVPAAATAAEGDGDLAGDSDNSAEGVVLDLATQPVENGLPLQSPAVVDTTDSEPLTADLPPSPDGTTPAPVAASVAASLVTPAPVAGAVPTPPVTAPVTAPVSSASKRLLPESTAKAAPAGAQGDLSVGSTATTVAAASDDGASNFDFAALTQAVEGERASVEPATSTNSGTSAPPALTRENPLRAYQTAAPAAAQVDVPVGRQGFSEAVLEKVMWFSAQQIGSAEIHLNPAELGPLSVRISTHQDQASVYFSSHHASVRDALDQALPRLREMFDNQGIQLLDAGVGEQRHARQQAGTQGEAGTANVAGDDGDGQVETGPSDSSRSLRVSQRLLDAYA